MKILLLSTYDRAGGAEKVALDLYRSYREGGHDVRLLVRYKRTKDDGVFEVDPYQQTLPWAPLCAALEQCVRRFSRFRGQYRLVDWLRRTAWPQRWVDHWRGVEDFNHPYFWHLLDEPGWRPDVIHAHNLHGDYFDLRALASLSQRIPVVWTLHDTWAFTGHCGYFIDCERWRTGCGNCPDLGRYPAILRDGTAENWERKRQIYTRSRLAVATPSRWLMGCVEQSILHPWRKRVIPNGVDLTVYRPGDQRQARDALGLPQNAFICMFIASTVSHTNPYKDYTTIERAVQMVAEQVPVTDLMFVCVGGSSKAVADSRFRYTGYVADPHRVALYYQAADVLLHAANAENFPCVILEALACGTPVIATAVGGIPEQVVDGQTGFLVSRRDAEAMAQHTLCLFQDRDMRRQMGHKAALRAEEHYCLLAQAETYVSWFQELVERSSG